MTVDELGEWRRTHFSAEISPKLDGEEVVVMGWVRDVRDLGGIRFIILQDKDGKVQVTVSQTKAEPEVFEKLHSLHRQDCVAVKGVVKKMDKASRRSRDHSQRHQNSRRCEAASAFRHYG